MDENLIIRSMVLALLSRPGEWIGFGRLADLVALPNCDDELVAALADYRTDLFATTRDRKVKLRPGTVEKVTKEGRRNWQVPAPPEREKLQGSARQPRQAPTTLIAGCYCSNSEDQILADLGEGCIPDEVLISSCCWRTICRIRGRNFSSVDPEIWRETCQRRGYIYLRENPRGF